MPRTKEQEKLYYLKNREKKIRQAKEHYLRNKAEIAKYQKRYREENKEHLRIYHQEYGRNRSEESKLKRKVYAGSHRVKVKIERPWEVSYHNARTRCNNPKHEHYKYYGGRGIKFLMAIEDFRKLWIRDKANQMRKPTIDRKENDGNYTFENCRFVELVDNLKRKGTYDEKR
jgi:hypothetical protein